MLNQMSVQKYKAVRFPILYIAALVTITMGFLYGYLKLPPTFDTNAVFSDTVCDTSGFFIFALVAAWFAGNDFLTRTIHNEIKAGYRRFSLILTRTVTTTTMVILLHLGYILSTVIGFSLKNGFDTSLFTVVNLFWLLTVLIQVCADICIVMFIVFSLKKATSAIAVAVVFAFIAFNVLRNFISESVFRLTPFSLAQTSDAGMLALSAVIAAAVIAGILTATHFVFRKAEIK